MQLKFIKTILEPESQINRINGLSWSPNNNKLAVATVDRSIVLYDEHGERRDKFATKPNDPGAGKKSYVIREICFSPDSTRLAVAQSDNIVFVYKLGEAWNDKKVICNKFPQSSSVMAMVWLASGAIVIGLEDGKVRALQCRNNKSQNLYASESMVISVASNYRGTGILTGHEDGSIIRYFMTDDHHESTGRIVTHSVAPFALAWSQNFVAAAGCDKKVTFYDAQGRFVRAFDYSRDDNEHEFMTATCSPNGQAIAIGGFNRARIYSWNPRTSTWSEDTPIEIENMYSVTALSWRRDGARLALGTVCGGVLMMESVLRRIIWQDKFELTYVAPSQVLIQSIQDGNAGKMILESQYGLEIDDVRIMGKDNYLVARTDNSLILCDLTRSLTSEISWVSTGRNEKFYFENPNVCLIFNAGELSLVEYGDHNILGSVRTEFVNPHVISVRLNERGTSKDNKKLAYLLDVKTICVVDLINQSTITQIMHDSKIDWLELSETSHKLLFRDKKMRLILIDTFTSRKQTLFGKVSFVQWVPQSDVVIAQNDSSLAVWYNIDLPEHVTMMTVRGEVMEVIREKGKTEVLSREGPTDHVYQLDEGLVEFGTAVNDSDYGRAILFLESLGDKPAAKAMWHNLANIALSQQNLHVAQRCYAALENASKTYYLSEMIKIAEKYEETHGIGVECPEVKARLALLNGDLRTAERIYLEQGDIESALTMYEKLKRWDDTIKLAERRGYPQLNDLKERQMGYLLSSNQEEKAGEVLESRGEVEKAMTLYLKAKKPARAARLALKTPQLLQQDELMNHVISSLVKAELYELAGDVSQRMSNLEGAVAFYRKGENYARAIEIARQVTPDDVINLEEEWGDSLVTKRQLDASISHFIEAGATAKALDAAMGAKQWRKAVQIAKVLDEPDEIKKYAIVLAEHLSLVGDLTEAENILVRSELYREAIELLNKYGKWEKAYELAERHLNGQNVNDMFIELGNKLEKEGKYRDAEKVFIAIGEPDKAIAMYKRIEHYDAMLRLVEKYHKDLLENTHLHLARQFESKGKFKNAEIHFIAAGDWKSVVHMYCGGGKWEDAYRISKQKGGEAASNQVAFMWAKSLTAEGAARLLTKLGLLDVVIDLACDAGQYNFALELSKNTGRNADNVHLKIAMSLEDEGKFEEAEAEFILANKPQEAILMYTHGSDWASALKVAEAHIPSAINDVLMAQAASALDQRDYQEWESLLIRAGRPDMILIHYRESEMWNDAIRIAKEHLPGDVAELMRQQNRSARSSAANNDSRVLLQSASEFARNEDFKSAIECLMQINETNADTETIEKALIRAAEICNQFLKGTEAMDVARNLGSRLVQIDQIGPAAQLFLAAELPKEAVDVFIRSQNWKKARRLAKEIDPQLVAYVGSQQKNSLKTDGNIEQLADIDIMGALDLLAEQGQWTRCIEKAKQCSSAILHKYLAMYATQLIRDGDTVQAMDLYLNYGVPAIPENFNIYHRIATVSFGLRETDSVTVWKNLRTFLYEVCQAISSSELSSGNAIVQFDLCLLIAHYYATRAACRKIPALQQLSVKISLALLRHTDIIPCDKGFYEAGMDLRSMGRESEAFVLLNHYLDVCEAIEEGLGNLVDHSDLTSTDFPSSVPIPEEIHLKNEKMVHEEIREWVLAISMDQKVDQSLPSDDRDLYESSLSGTDQACIITGYPVMGRQPVSFQRSNRLANREAWSKLTVSAKMIPHTDVSDVIDFIEKWCGAANFISN